MTEPTRDEKKHLDFLAQAHAATMNTRMQLLHIFMATWPLGLQTFPRKVMDELSNDLIKLSNEISAEQDRLRAERGDPASSGQSLAATPEPRVQLELSISRGAQTRTWPLTDEQLQGTPCLRDATPEPDSNSDRRSSSSVRSRSRSRGR